MSTNTTPELSLPERHRKITVKEAAQYNGLSEATFRRAYPHLVRKISARRDAVEVGDAIDLPPPPQKLRKPAP